MIAPLALASLVASLAVACAGADFTPSSTLKSVRVLGTKADKPYAKPGDVVHVELLAVDARKTQPEPMQIFWMPFLCEDPYQDLYYACFSAFGGASPPSSNAGGKTPPPIPDNIARLIEPGVDLSSYFVQGPAFHFAMPSDAITLHPPVPGATAPYGLVVLFNMVCAGHVEGVARPPDNPQAPPFGCFDKNGKQLGPDDYAIGFTRVYAYDQRANQNPVIGRLLFDGKEVDPAIGITYAHCTAGKKEDCPSPKLDVDVPDSSDEVNDGDIDPQSGQPRKEEIWADWFVTDGAGEISKNDTELLYEPRVGRLTGNEAEYRPPPATGDGTLYVVVRDNRGGAVWQQTSIHVQ